MSVLIVDDSRIMRNIVKNCLRRLEFDEEKFFEASNGVEAFELLEHKEIELLLVDWNMPQLDGLSLVKKLRSDQKYEDLPIIMVTSEAAKYNVIEAVKAGVNDYMVKPVNEKALHEKISRLLEG